MAKTTANDLIQRAAVQLDDVGYANWQASELLDYLNEGLRALVKYAPTQFSVVESVTLQPGTRQTLPTGGVALIRVIRAINADASPGRAALPFDKAVMDAASPDWHQATEGAVRQWAYDPNDPTVYWVYPPQPSPAEKAEIEYVKSPVALSLGTELPVDERFEQALVDYMLSRAYGKDSEYAGEDGRAARHYAAYLEAVSGESG